MNVENAVLCLVRMHPDVTGYLIKTIFDKSPGHIVPMHLSKIYPALKRLTEKGLLSCRSAPQKGRLDQKFYTITPLGQEELDRWFKQPFKFGESRTAFDEYLLWLGSMAYMDDDHVLGFIDQGISYLEQRLAVESNVEHIKAGLDYITLADEEEAERHRKLFSMEHELLEEETRNYLKWLRQVRKEFE